ncbi:MAG: hypothetical protein IJV72_02840 [Clostridia bacterium]|nr:hypothetical protein [Clostridia bacterium]
MNNEQNIDDILKLLKSSYGEDGDAAHEESGETEDNSGSISHEELQDRLKRQFMSGESGEGITDADSEDSFSYDLDDTILADAESDFEMPESLVSAAEEEIIAEEEITETEEEAISEEEEDDGIPPFDLEPVSELSEEIFDVVEDTDEDVKEYIESLLDEAEAELDGDGTLFDDEDDFDGEDEIFVENEDGEIVLVKAEDVSALSQDDFVEATEELDDVLELVETDTETETETEIEAEAEPDAEIEEEELFSDESGQLAIFEMSEEVVADEESESESVETDDEDALQIAMDFGESCTEEVEYSEAESDGDGALEQIDDSMLGIMLEFGDVSALEASVGADRMDAYISRAKRDGTSQINPDEAFAFDGEEFEDEEQTEELLAAYSKEKMFTGLRALGCAFFTVLLFIYELISALDIEMELVPNYVEYPVVYLLVGMQLLVFSAAFAWRELLSGIKKAFTFKADRWSFVSLSCLFVFIYGAALTVISPNRISHMFGTAASLYVLAGLIFEYAEVCREIKCFDIYSSDKNKFTVSTKPTAGSCAEKMYRGGVPRESRIFEPRKVDFPRGYFSAVNLSGETDKLITYSITPVIIMAAVAAVVCAMLGGAAEASVATFIIIILALCPISSFAIHTLPIYKMSSHLYRRGSAVAGEVMASKYADCDYMVFADMHLFKVASAEDNGIVIYDESNARAVVEYLDALYSAIGGPMSGVFGGVSEGKYTVKLRRIAKNGVEAVVDGKHSLILGDAEFGRRYGIAFSGMENTREGDGILGFAVDGRPAAKLCCRYKCEPLFEMLLEKLGENGIRCAIETYDPAINSAFAAACRNSKTNPVNVIHKNVSDYYNKAERASDEDTGLVVCASRLKLIESVIWCKKFRKALKICSVLQWVIFGIICAGLIALTVFDLIGGLNQYYLLLIQALTLIPAIGVTALVFPKNDYFSA